MSAPRNLLNGGQLIVDYLVREGVPYVFGLCGHGNIGLLDALYERKADIKRSSVPTRIPAAPESGSFPATG